jgi:Sap-like sulfolipid-1-addressing protein
MGSLLVELLPFAAGLAVTPAAIATGILFLGSKRPLGNAIAFAAAFSLVYAGLAAVVLGAAHAATEPLIAERTKNAITLAVGLLLLFLALLAWLRGRGRPPHRPRWLDMVEDASPREALGLGVALAVLNPNIPILLAGLATVTAADVSTADRMVGAAFLLAASQLGLVGPMVWYVWCGMWPGPPPPGGTWTGSGTGWPGTSGRSTSASWSSSACCSPPRALAGREAAAAARAAAGGGARGPRPVEPAGHLTGACQAGDGIGVTQGSL